MRWLSQLFSRNRRYDDVSASIREHIQERTEELIGEGMAPLQAGQTARREAAGTGKFDQRWRTPRRVTGATGIQRGASLGPSSPIGAAGGAAGAGGTSPDTCTLLLTSGWR